MKKLIFILCLLLSSCGFVPYDINYRIEEPRIEYRHYPARVYEKRNRVPYNSWEYIPRRERYQEYRIVR